MRIILSIIQAMLFLISSFAVNDSNFKFLVDRAALDLTSTADVAFESITAEEMSVTESEKQRCREWYNSNILCDDEPAYNFKYGIKSFRRNVDDWTFSIGEESEVGAVYRGGKTSYITLTNDDNGLVVTVEATIYEEKATCEWTVFIKNTADKKSPVISKFNAADCVLPIGKSSVYMSKGTEPAADDFELVKSYVNSMPMQFNANGGRSESVLPYFNISGENSGVVFCVGWSGQWFASIEQRIKGIEIIAKQEDLKGYLAPGEEIRSPLVSLTFYEGNNALKGFNMSRDWTVDCVYPENIEAMTTSGIGAEIPGTTISDMVASIRNSPKEFTDSIDAYWIDAGWYPIKTNWGDSVGTWTPDPTRFPEGFAPVAEAAAERGVDLLLWYEPERCSQGTEVYNECIKHEGWLVEQDEERNMVNFANEGALEYITDVILTSLKTNKVSVFRVDSIPAPQPFWEEADKMWSDGRKGFTENHYVTNFYRFLDTLLTEIPNLKIDNCCSGGKRIDIEMSRRSIPLWRSDYNCQDGEGKAKSDIVEATQAQTYGISFWLPLNGTCAYVYNEYANRTNIISCSQQVGYNDIREHMTGNYYPLTYAGLDLERFQATQYDTDNGSEGVALIYKRENVESNTYILKLNGLAPDKNYELYDYDSPETKYTVKGDKLMSEGIEITINDTPKAVIILYKAK